MKSSTQFSWHQVGSSSSLFTFVIPLRDPCRRAENSWILCALMLSAIHILYTYINTFVFRHPSASNRLSCRGCRHRERITSPKLWLVHAWYVSRRYFLVLQFSFPINANANSIEQRNCSCTRRILISITFLYTWIRETYTKEFSSTAGVRVVAYSSLRV